MKTEMNKVAAFVATAVWADGVVEEAERIAVNEIADALGFDEKAFNEAVDKSGETVKDLDDEQLKQHLIEAAVDVDEEDAETIFECAIQVVIADNVLAAEEVGDLIRMADALGIDTERAILMIADMVKSEPELEVEL